MTAAEPFAPPVLEVQDLHVRLPQGSDRAYAVEAVSFAIGARETLCIVGESGSGKSVTASAVMGLLPPGVLTLERGQIALSGQDITRAPLAQLRQLRGDRMAMVFQEPMTA
jgi:peptide/nickel transport system ATP-binding protein